MLTKAKPSFVDEEPWTAIPDTSQEFALSDSNGCHHILYTGARGPGKTDTQLMRFRSRVGIGYGAFWRGIIFDREYKNLDDLVSKSKRWFPRYNDGCRFLESKSDYKWVWPTGEELLFRSISKAEDYWNYHGQEYPFIGWNELCKQATSYLYERLMSCNRSSFTPAKDNPNLPPIPLEVFSTTNPYGPGHNWVKLRFIDPAPFGVIVENTTRVFDPQIQQERDVTKRQICIHGSYKENIYLSAEYIAELSAITDENVRKAWLEGDWDVVAGGALDDVWSKQAIIQRFKIPASWRVDRVFDWGSTHPFYVGWFAEANGEEAELANGVKFCPPAKSLILIHEWYGTKTLGSNIGLKMSAGDIAKGIRAIEEQLLDWDWIVQQPYAGPADNQIRDVREKDVETIEKKMSDQGIKWTASDKSPGSRKNGLQLVRDRLEATKKQTEDPRLYFMEHCRSAISTIPSLPRSTEPGKFDDVDTEAEDHPYDGVRYKCLSGSHRYATKIKTAIAT